MVDKKESRIGEKIVNDWKLLVILVTIGLSVLYLRKYIGAKAENLAQKEDLRALTDIVEGVRAQFERANLVHRVQFEAEFRACQNVWREANNTHREFVRLFPVAFGKPTPFQRGEFISAQLAFADAFGGVETLYEPNGVEGVLRIRKLDYRVERR